MTPVDSELMRIGLRMRAWRAQAVGLRAAGVGLAALALCAFSDLLFRYGRAGRIVAGALIACSVGAGIALILRALSRRLTPEAVAASVEHAFPELDNRLINHVQFSAQARRGPLEQQLLREGVPGWGRLEVGRLRDRRAHRQAWLAFGGALLLALAPGLWTNRAWTNAVLRILNPFSNRPASTLAAIRGVQPGDAVVLQGSPVLLACSVEGRRGQPVSLDLWPTDGRRTSFRLGRLAGKGVEEFPYRLEAAATSLRYRFRAGDDESRIFDLEARPPLAFESLRVRVTPPGYTQLEPRDYDALAEEPEVPEGSRLTVEAACNYGLASLSAITGAATQRVEAAGRSGSFDVPVDRAGALRVAAEDTGGYTAEAEVRLRFVPDRAPAIQVLAPTAPVVLGAGSQPQVQWQVSDDYGVGTVEIVQVLDADGAATNLAVLAAWPGDGARDVPMTWSGAASVSTGTPVIVLKVAATDTAPGILAHRTESAPIVFQAAGALDALDQQKKAQTDMAASLDLLLRIQGENLDRTRALAQTVGSSQPPQWEEVAQVQEEVRRIGGQLLADPRRPLGALRSVMERLYHGAMADAVAAARGVPQAAEAERPGLAGQTVDAEERILASLTRMAQGAERIEQHAKITGLLALLDKLVTGQEQARDRSKAQAPGEAAVDSKLVDLQDGLAADAAEFVRACRTEADGLRKGDAAFADLILKVAGLCEQRQVSPNMIRAAEQLDAGAPADALPLQEAALAALRECQELLASWRVADAEEKAQALQEAVSAAREKIEKLKNLQARVVESMKEIDPQADKSDKAYDELGEEVDELKKNIQEATLQVAKDLHIFPELPVGNDLVEDVYQVFEEMEQVAGSADDKAWELGLQKEDWILELLEKAEGRADDMEMWLTPKPDNVQRNTENFDQAEMPKIPVLPMPSELEDIIGDLLEQEEEEKKKSDDSATNQGSPDIAAGWDIAEGEFVNYSAKGKSGNQAPDHKEQDGRSLVGRQGMSDGETTAGSGKINEGDENIEARRTRDSAQSGQVQEEGHAEAKATGGGKSSGYAEETGMAGQGPRRDAAMPGSELGLQSMLRRDAEAAYAKASLMHIRTSSLEDAIGAMRRAEEASAAGRIQQVREFQRQAVVALKKAKAELEAGVAAEALSADYTPPPVPEKVAGVADEAPAEYRELVSEYFKSLNRTP